MDGGDVDSGRCSRLHPVGPDAKRLQLLGQSVRSAFADSASNELLTSDEKFASEKGSGGQNNRARLENPPSSGTDSAKFSILNEERFCNIFANI